jgi:hypothetical protein
VTEALVAVRTVTPVVCFWVTVRDKSSQESPISALVFLYHGSPVARIYPPGSTLVVAHVKLGFGTNPLVKYREAHYIIV